MKNSVSVWRRVVARALLRDSQRGAPHVVVKRGTVPSRSHPDRHRGHLPPGLSHRARHVHIKVELRVGRNNRVLKLIYHADDGHGQVKVRVVGQKRRKVLSHAFFAPWSL